MNTVVMTEKKVCQMAGCVETARYDAKTSMGPWAYLCVGHFETMATFREAACRLRYGKLVAE